MIEFKAKNGAFSYSDKDRTLLFESPNGEPQKVVAPEGFTMRFIVKRCGMTAYFLCPAMPGADTFVSYAGCGAVTGEKK